jgi:hypothetical protein
MKLSCLQHGCWNTACIHCVKHEPIELFESIPEAVCQSELGDTSNNHASCSEWDLIIWCGYSL